MTSPLSTADPLPFMRRVQGYHSHIAPPSSEARFLSNRQLLNFAGVSSISSSESLADVDRLGLDSLHRSNTGQGRRGRDRSGRTHATAGNTKRTKTTGVNRNYVPNGLVRLLFKRPRPPIISGEGSFPGQQRKEGRVVICVSHGASALAYARRGWRISLSPISGMSLTDVCCGRERWFVDESPHGTGAPFCFGAPPSFEELYALPKSCV